MTFEKPLWMQNNTYPARLDRGLFAQLWDEGVMDLTALKVTQRAAGANFTVDVSIGDAVVTGDDQTDQGNYLVKATAVENATITAAPGSNSRYDIVCLRINDPNAGGNTGDTASIVVTAGTVSASPTVPATPASSLLLAIIGPITSATSSITNAIITDSRVLAGRRDRPGIIDWTASANVPNGWLKCYGQAISRTTYARLFAEIGTVHGAGDGSTTFNVPDLRGRVAVGLDNMGGSDAGRLSASNTLGGSGGAETHTLSAAEIPAHTHPIDHNHGSANIQAAGSDVWIGGIAGDAGTLGGSGIATGGTYVLSADLPNYTGNSGNNTGGGGAHNNLQPYLLLNALIRT